MRTHCIFLLPAVFLLAGSQVLSAQVQDHPSPSPTKRKNAGRIAIGVWQKWLSEDVVYIITDQEHADFAKLTTDEQRDKFIEDFWERRNPAPGSQENKFKEEHYRRVAYTNENFAAEIPGWKTDRGRIYIIYGPPDERAQNPGRSNVGTSDNAPLSVRYPSEVWRYRYIEGVGRNVAFEFIDSCRCGKYELREDPTKIREKNPDGSSQSFISDVFPER